MLLHHSLHTSGCSLTTHYCYKIHSFSPNLIMGSCSMRTHHYVETQCSLFPGRHTVTQADEMYSIFGNWIMQLIQGTNFKHFINFDLQQIYFCVSLSGKKAWRMIEMPDCWMSLVRSRLWEASSLHHLTNCRLQFKPAVTSRLIFKSQTHS